MNKIKFISLAAGIALATAFTIGCGGSKPPAETETTASQDSQQSPTTALQAELDAVGTSALRKAEISAKLAEDATLEVAKLKAEAEAKAATAAKASGFLAGPAKKEADKAQAAATAAQAKAESLAKEAAKYAALAAAAKAAETAVEAVSEPASESAE